jgi:hypothetical protein
MVTKRKPARAKRKPRDWIANLTVFGIDKMTLNERLRLGVWLRSRADWIVKHGDLAASRLIQRWMKPGDL